MTTTEPICPRCGQLMIRGWDHINCQDRADTLRAQRAADSKEHLETWKRLKQAEAERDALYRKATDEVWYWQGDGYDMPELLACPVLMDADTLRDLLEKVAMSGERDQLAAEVVQLGSLRPEVLAFASVMEYVLQNNDDKGGWKDCDPEWLLGRLEDEVRELREVLRVNLNRAFRNETEIRYEAADVANFAMMIADVCGALAATPQAAKFAERVRMLEDVVKAAELVIRADSSSRDNYYVPGLEALRSKLNKLAALDKPEVQDKGGFMERITVVCDRCGSSVDGLEEEGVGTGGFYRRPGWGQYMNEGENTICDACMQNDARYRAAR